MVYDLSNDNGVVQRGLTVAEVANKVCEYLTDTYRDKVSTTRLKRDLHLYGLHSIAWTKTRDEAVSRLPNWQRSGHGFIRVRTSAYVHLPRREDSNMHQQINMWENSKGYGPAELFGTLQPLPKDGKTVSRVVTVTEPFHLTSNHRVYWRDRKGLGGDRHLQYVQRLVNRAALVVDIVPDI